MEFLDCLGTHWSRPCAVRAIRAVALGEMVEKTAVRSFKGERIKRLGHVCISIVTKSSRVGGRKERERLGSQLALLRTLRPADAERNVDSLSSESLSRPMGCREFLSVHEQSLTHRLFTATLIIMMAIPLPIPCIRTVWALGIAIRRGIPPLTLPVSVIIRAIILVMAVVVVMMVMIPVSKGRWSS